ncbi:hypothetical protein J14TS5_37270 [Paenibacillus lautus]|uniref:hypothetical protein n=1 Tax=Paenibacillus lautus TaxID=1401 RepID=UPI001B2D2B0C|nr:hypothetical protein [Paenibacillus lautus]GIO98641.1 hypothetical protein J14TS5_37270 [Paenibacillus lautus]
MERRYFQSIIIGIIFLNGVIIVAETYSASQFLDLGQEEDESRDERLDQLLKENMELKKTCRKSSNCCLSKGSHPASCASRQSTE